MDIMKDLTKVRSFVILWNKKCKKCIDLFDWIMYNICVFMRC